MTHKETHEETHEKKGIQNCTYCQQLVLDTQVITGPHEQPFCSGKCRDIWIWRSLEQPSKEAFDATLVQARAAQLEYFRKLRDIHRHQEKGEGGGGWHGD